MEINIPELNPEMVRDSSMCSEPTIPYPHSKFTIVSRCAGCLPNRNIDGTSESYCSFLCG